MHITLEYNENLLPCLSYMFYNRKCLNEEITRRNKDYTNNINKGWKGFISFVEFEWRKKYIKRYSNKFDFIMFNVLEQIKIYS